MSYYAMLVPAYTGHLQPDAGAWRARCRSAVTASRLSQRLRRRRKFAEEGWSSCQWLCRNSPPGEWARTTTEMAELAGWQASRFAGQWLRRFARGILRDLPEIVERERFDGLVMDQISIGGESVCHAMNLPMAVACNSLLGHAESRVPPVVFSWPFRPGLLFRARNIRGAVHDDFDRMAGGFGTAALSPQASAPAAELPSWK